MYSLELGAAGYAGGNGPAEAVVLQPHPLQPIEVTELRRQRAREQIVIQVQFTAQAENHTRVQHKGAANSLQLG